MHAHAGGSADPDAKRADGSGVEFVAIDVASRGGERNGGSPAKPRILYRLLSTNAENELQQQSRNGRRSQVDEPPRRLLSAQAPSLRRTFTRAMSSFIEELFWCPICLEKQPVSRSMTLSACGHRYCHDCVKAYAESKIADGQIYPVCFFVPQEGSPRNSTYEAATNSSACGAALTPDDIRLLVSSEVWAKYEMFKFNKENSTGRQCPYCGHSQVCSGPKQPVCTCSACHQVFCFTHGNAHPGGSCADYEHQQVEVEKVNRAAISAISKPCPGCKASVEKNGGCNHMKCVLCHTNFCWICGAIVDDSITPQHFAWWNMTGCAGQQMVATEHQSRCERIFDGVILCFMMVFIGLPSLLITLMITLVTCCWLPCILRGRVSFSDCFADCFAAVVVLVTLAPDLVFQLLWLLFQLIGCIFSLCD